MSGILNREYLKRALVAVVVLFIVCSHIKHLFHPSNVLFTPGIFNTIRKQLEIIITVK